MIDVQNLPVSGDAVRCFGFHNMSTGDCPCSWKEVLEPILSKEKQGNWYKASYMYQSVHISAQVHVDFRYTQSMLKYIHNTL